MNQVFPPNFRWGVATSAFQIEGATKVDGRGETNWDEFCRQPGKVLNGDTGDIACDHYHRFPEDIKIMQDLGIKNYRFSFAWSRMFPNGQNDRNEKGFEFYDRLIDSLLAADISPLPTIFHWDLPLALQHKGGFANREITKYFADYSASVVEHFGDRLKTWITINEPWVITWLGYFAGVMAPGIKDLSQAIASAHHTALAHGMADRAMRAVRSDLKIGLNVNLGMPLANGPQTTESLNAIELIDAQFNQWWINALVHGQYPQILVDEYGENLTKVVLPGDMDIVKTKPDFLAINYYRDEFVKPSHSAPMLSSNSPFPFDIHVDMTPPPDLEFTDFNWPITSNGFTNMLVRLHRDWPEIPEFMVTENGCSYHDDPNENGQINDHRRVKFFSDHIEALGNALKQGVPISGYYTWSLLDNFEWASGYKERFGLVYVDFETLKRTPKLSAYAYRDLIKKYSD